MKHRLFIGLRLPHPIVQQLLGMMGGIEGARWQSAEQLHLTSLFLGSCDHHQAEDVAHYLLDVHVPPFSLALDGLGHFGKAGHLDSLWAGVRPHEPLHLLHQKLHSRLRPLKLDIPKRAYMPHITLARFNRFAGDIAPFLASHAALSSAPFEVDAFYLFESHLTQAGAYYESIARYSLAG